MKSTFYFPHDYNARTSQELINLIQAHGWEGYGLYWAVIEKMHEAGGSLDYKLESIAFDLRTNVALVDSVVNNFDLFRKKGEIFFSDRVRRNIRKRKDRTRKAKISADISWVNRKSERNANA